MQAKPRSKRFFLKKKSFKIIYYSKQTYFKPILFLRYQYFVKNIFFYGGNIFIFTVKFKICR